MTAMWLMMCLMAGEAGYAKPQMLVQPAELKAGKFIVLDARSADDYKAGHIPRAFHVPAEQWAEAFRGGVDATGWARRIGGLGIDGTRPVVLYDDDRSRTAARLWWILRYWGIRDVRILNGGWKAWQAAGGKVDKGIYTPKPVEVKLSPEAARLATREQIQRGLRSAEFGQLLDTRSLAEFCGEAKTAKRNGAIPGAKHLEWSQTLDKKTGRFKSAAELKQLFEEVGIDLKQPATAYCQSGGRAAVVAFVVELMTGKPARNYYRSWAEWGNHPDTPIESKKPKR